MQEEVTQKTIAFSIKSAKLDAVIPANLRAAPTADGVTWTGFSTRARVIVYDPLRVKAADVATYEQLADPKLKGMVCSRSGSHPYNLSLLAAIIAHEGEAKAEQWARGMVANFARAPKGGDTDQIKAVAAGECGVAISNSYYVARLMRSDKPEDRAVVEKVGVVFPNQSSWGTHVNVAGGAVALLGSALLSTLPTDTTLSSITRAGVDITPWAAMAAKRLRKVGLCVSTSNCSPVSASRRVSRPGIGAYWLWPCLR